MDLEEGLSLTLTPDNVLNTTLVSESGERFYTVIMQMTENGKRMTTEIRDFHDEAVATIQYHDVLPNKVAFGNDKPMFTGEWLKKSLVPFKDDNFFTDSNGRKYKWRNVSMERAFELYCADDNYTAPIGRFERGHLVFPRAAPGNFDDAASVVSATPTLVEATWTQSVLTLAPRALEAQDMVVTSFLVLEKAFRARERERQNRANLLGGARGGHGMYHGFTGGYI